MQNVKLSVRYARALFEMALEHNALDRVYADMMLIKETAEASRDLRLLLRNPVIDKERKKTIVRQIFEGKISDASVSFLDLVIDQRREPNMANIIDAYVDLQLEHKNIKRAIVSTVVPLTDGQRRQLKEKLSAYTGSEIQLIEQLNEKLVGGISVKVGDLIFDDSLLRKLREIREEFSENIYESKV